MLAPPGATPVTMPSEPTAAIAAFELDQSTAAPGIACPNESMAVADTATWPPTEIVALVGCTTNDATVAAELMTFSAEHAKTKSAATITPQVILGRRRMPVPPMLINVRRLDWRGAHRGAR
jgi:hypothetical protein